MKTDKELQEKNPELYRVARGGGTEAPHSGEYADTKEDGMYHCAVCGAALFSSDTKFKSGYGWPSFTDPAHASAVELREDTSHGMKRMEVVCTNCGAHLGHVFPDGPEKDEKVCDRYCINSVSLSLKSEKENPKSLSR